MANTLNEQERKVIAQYTGFPEGERLTYTKVRLQRGTSDCEVRGSDFYCILSSG